MKHVSPKSDGFTLIELLVVITIITILAGLTIATFRFAQISAARNRAKAEVDGLSLAIESYKIDNGDYPRDVNTDAAAMNAASASGSNGLNALVGTNTAYMLSSVALYKALSGDGADGSTPDRTLSAAEKAAGAKAYFPFKPNMLYPKFPAGSTQTVTAIIDPFKNVYGYSTIGSGTAAATGVSGYGYNPTFDLWSTADIDQKGKTPTAAWITNW